MVETRRFEQYAMILISTQYDLDSALIFIVHLVELTIVLCLRVCDLGETIPNLYLLSVLTGVHIRWVNCKEKI